jgi:hypothetical protein
MRKLIWLSVFLMSITNLTAQLDAPMVCGTPEHSENVLPMGFLKNRSNRNNTPKEIKVVVHIIYSDSIEGSYIPEVDAPLIIGDAINQLNVDFAGTDISFNLWAFDYTDMATYTWYESYEAGGVCFPTYQTQATQLANDVAWDISEYCNIYVIPKMCSTILGYAYVGYGPNNEDDGIWVLTETFGTGTWPHLNPSYNENETLTHEMGHYCGLFHVFQGTGNCGGNSDSFPCEYKGDYVCDTPPTKASTACPNGVGFPCVANNYWGVPFSANNHMDYSPQSCRNEFTLGQIERMHAMLEYQRYELYSDDSVIPFCPGDFNSDGNIGTSDLLTILANYGCVGCGPSQGDVTLDYNVNVNDLNWILAYFGETCGDGIGMLEGLDETRTNTQPISDKEEKPKPISYKDLYAVLNSKPNSLLQVYDITGRKLVSSYVYIDIESLGLTKGIYIIELLSIDGNREIIKIYLD